MCPAVVKKRLPHLRVDSSFSLVQSGVKHAPIRTMAIT
jgi:hypothetical protein